MDRRRLLFGSLAFASARQAFGQPTEQVMTVDTRPIEGDDELWFLLSTIDTLIFVLTDIALKDPKVVAQTKQDFQPYGAQLADPGAFDIFNAALLSDEGQARIQEQSPMLLSATQRVSSLLSDGILSASLGDTISKSFLRASILLLARSASNGRWWCNCYGLKMIDC
jgi:hypothetical protein